MAEEPLIAVFVDYENLALGVRDMKAGRLQLDLVLKRLLERGRIVFKRAYCDWSQYRNESRDLHQLGIEMVDIPRSRMSGKNSADIHMVVDAMDLCHSKEHIEVFALLTGDSDFSPLAAKLKENDKRVLGCGVKQSTSELLISSCDEFLYYDDLVRIQKSRTSVSKRKKDGGRRDEKKDEAFDRLLEIVRNLEQDYDPLWGSMVKQTIRRVYPGFNEGYYGYKTFSDLLEEAAEQGLLDLDYDETRGNYTVRSREA